MNETVYKSKTSTVVRLDPAIYGPKNEYAIFPAGSGAACALISFQRGVTEPNGCMVEDLMRVLVDKQMGIANCDRYHAIRSLTEMLEYMKREK